MNASHLPRSNRLLGQCVSMALLPELLVESPPRDAWGNAVIYERIAPDRAMLRSAGPDGRAGTKDDVRREVRAGR